MNAKVNPVAMQKILMEFEKQSEIMDTKQEVRCLFFPFCAYVYTRAL
jgi:hypothetical protein